jgi:hypothetical protein
MAAIIPYRIYPALLLPTVQPVCHLATNDGLECVTQIMIH